MAKKAKKKKTAPIKPAKIIKTQKPVMKVFNLGLTDENIIEKFKKIVPLLKDLNPTEKITQPRALELLIDGFDHRYKKDMPNLKPGQAIVDENAFNDLKESYHEVWDADLTIEANIFACINFERNALFESNKKLNDSASESEILKKDLEESKNQLNAIKVELEEQKTKVVRLDNNIPLQDSELQIISLNEKLKQALIDKEALTLANEDLQTQYDRKKEEVENITDNALKLVDPQFIAEFDEELTLRALNNKNRIIKLGAIDESIATDEYPGALCVIATDFYLTSVEAMYAKKK